MMKTGLRGHLRLVACTAVTLVALSGVSHGEKICGLETAIDKTKAGVRHEGWTAMCVASQGCLIVSPVAGKGHRLKLFRMSGKEEWLLKLETPEDVFADLLEGVTLTVDKGEAMRVPPEFLREGSDGRGIVIRSEVAPVVLKEMSRGKTLRWTYHTDGGEEVGVTVRIGTLVPVARWASCMDKKLRKTNKGGPSGETAKKGGEGNAAGDAASSSRSGAQSQVDASASRAGRRSDTSSSDMPAASPYAHSSPQAAPAEPGASRPIRPMPSDADGAGDARAPARETPR